MENPIKHMREFINSLDGGTEQQLKPFSDDKAELPWRYDKFCKQCNYRDTDTVVNVCRRCEMSDKGPSMFEPSPKPPAKRDDRLEQDRRALWSKIYACERDRNCVDLGTKGTTPHERAARAADKALEMFDERFKN